MTKWSMRNLVFIAFTTMAPLLFEGSFAGVPARIAVEDSVSSSSVSLTFLRINNVPQSVRIHDGVSESSSFGPVMVPTPSGWYQSTMLFNASQVRNSDVVLGGDWLNLVSPSLTSVGVRDPLSGNINSLSNGHSWIPSPSVGSRQCFSSSFVCLH